MTASCAFFLAACQYPGGMLDRSKRFVFAERSTGYRPGPADQSLLRLLRVAEHQDARQLVLAGDQIYVDATAGLFDPLARDAPLESAYRRRSENYWWREVVLGRMQIIASAIDDHEISDNWEPSCHWGRDAALRDTMRRAREKFIEHQRSGNRPGGPRGDAELPLWLERRVGQHLLFAGDTRTERGPRDPARIESARIMSDAQFEALRAALLDEQRRHGARHKFVLTPAMLLPRRLSTAESTDPAVALRSDAWDGYPGSLHALLAWLVDNRIEGCVFLSGNEHIGCVTKATAWRVGAGEASPLALWSVHAGAMYAPYPFANAVEEDFAATDRFEFEVAPAPDRSARRYVCQVESWFARTGDGFARVSVVDDSLGASRLAVKYYDGRQAGPDADWPG